MGTKHLTKEQQLTPQLSIITPNYNHAQSLEQHESVLNQTSPPNKYIIIDDASMGHSVSIIKKLTAHKPFTAQGTKNFIF